MHPLYGALPIPYVPVQVTLCALVPHWYTYMPPLSGALQYHGTFLPLSVSQWNDFADPVSDGVGLVGFKRKNNFFY